MVQKKKLQVFVSSTYNDLKEERQAAVEAILTAGHIPAGMELFAAGDESQMDVIKRWISESDVFLLLLGGRYGSVESKSKKSYTQLEWEYAAEQGKPSFAIVMEEDYLEEKVKKFGTKVFETSYPEKLKEFRGVIMSTRMVKQWRDPRDIKLAVLETLAEFSRREALVGWIPGSEAVNAGVLAEEIARLTKENTILRDKVANLSAASAIYKGLTFEEMYKLLIAKIDTSGFTEEGHQKIKEITNIFGDPEPALIHYFVGMSEVFRQKNPVSRAESVMVSRLEHLGLVERVEQSSFTYRLTETGTQFLLRLRLERDVESAERFILKPEE